MKERQGNERKEKTSPTTTHMMRLRRYVVQSEGLDWRGVTYAVVLTDQGCEGR